MPKVAIHEELQAPVATTVLKGSKANASRGFARSAALVALAMMASPLSAQMTGSRLGQNADSDDALGVFQNMVRCVGERQPRYAYEILRTVPGSESERQEIFGNTGDLAMCLDDKSRRLVIPDNVELRMTPRHFRTTLAQVMARNAVKNIEESALAETSPWSPAVYETGNEPDETVDRVQLGLYQFGDCVLAAKPLEAVALVQADAGSAEASAAVQGLMPALGPCLQEGVELKLTTENLVVALSEPMVHRALQLSDDAQNGTNR